MDDKYIQGEELVAPLEARLADMQALPITAHLDCDALRAANDYLLKNRDTDRQELSAGWGRILKLEAELRAPHNSYLDLDDVVRGRDSYEILLQSLAAQILGLQARYADSVSRAQGSQARFCNDLGPLLKEFEHLFTFYIS